MSPDELINKAILETVPQLYEANAGSNSYDFTIGSSTITRFTHRAFTPDLEWYTNECIVRFGGIALTTPLYEETEFQRIQQMCATLWLEKRTGFKNWAPLLDYFSRLQKRTIENNSVCKFLVVDRSTDPSTYVPGADVGDPRYLKLTDWVGTGPYTFLRVTEDLRLISSESVGDIILPTSYQFLPTFIYPVAKQLKSTSFGKDVLVCSNQRGDLLIAEQNEIIASRRQGRWTVYVPQTLKNSIHDCISECSRIAHSGNVYGISCTLFQVLFDMSFKRHGGLLIVDKDKTAFRGYTTGGVREGDPDLDSLFPKSRINTTTPDHCDLRKLIELSSVDGAVLLTETGTVHGFGAMVTSGSGPASYGARTTAARNAAQAGGIAFKVSSDGEIVIYFQTPAKTGTTIHEIHFL